MNKMKRFRLHWLVIGLLLLAIFNILFFWLKPEDGSSAIWISYAFIHLAYLELILIPFFAPRSKSRHVFIENMSVIAVIYLVVELIVGSVFILFAVKPWQLALFTQLILFIVNIIVLYIILLANQKTAGAENRGETNRSVMKAAMTNLQKAIPLVEKADKKMISDAFDELKASPEKVDAAVSGMESNILLASEAILEAARNNQQEDLRKQTALLVQMAKLRKGSAST